MNLTDFLLQRITEDEAVARAEGPNQPHGMYCGWSLHEGPGFSDDGCQCGLPARVLAECEAKRRIVDEHQVEGPQLWQPRCIVCDEAPGTYETSPKDWPCPTLRALARPYRDHPDFRQEWR